jgi:hypothetical protein
MKRLFTSASKIVFIIFAIGIHLALFIGKISGDQYLVMAAMPLTFYFANKGDGSGGDGVAGETPYLGK